MSLESHLPRERLNIKHLAVEQPENEPVFSFDPEKEINEQDWQKILTKLENLHQKENSYAYAQLAAKLVQLVPSSRSRLPLTDEISQWLVREQSKYYFGSASPGSVKHEYVSSVAILFPERRGELDINMRQKQNMLRNEGSLGLEVLGNSDNPEICCGEATDFLVLFPDAAADLHLNEKAFNNLKRVMQDRAKTEMWSSVLSIASALRLLFPQKWHEVRLAQETQKRLLEYVKSSRDNDNWNEFVSRAVLLVALTAEKAELTPTGLRYKFAAPKMGSSTLPAPEPRKF